MFYWGLAVGLFVGACVGIVGASLCVMARRGGDAAILQEMTVREFEDAIWSIRSLNGWRIELSCNSVWEVRVYSKETGRLLAETGSTGLRGILSAFKIPFDECPWV